MEALSALLSSISTVLWPLIVIAAMVFLRPAVTDLIQSAKSRKFTIKIGGQELTMEEANEQQLALITDLQSQVADIRRSTGRRTECAVANSRAIISSLGRCRTKEQ